MQHNTTTADAAGIIISNQRMNEEQTRKPIWYTTWMCVLKTASRHKRRNILHAKVRLHCLFFKHLGRKIIFVSSNKQVVSYIISLMNPYHMVHVYHLYQRKKPTASNISLFVNKWHHMTHRSCMRCPLPSLHEVLLAAIYHPLLHR